MRHLLLLALLALAAPACVTNPETGQRELDVPLVVRELRLAAEDLRGFAMVEPEADLAEDLLIVADQVEYAADVLANSGGTDGVSLARSAIAALLPRVSDPNVRFYLVAADALLRRVEAYSA